jgi:hypothetical protein
VAELERQLRDRMADEGEIEDDRPQLATRDAELYYNWFYHLLQGTGTGAVNLDYLAIRAWATDHHQDRALAEEVMFGLLNNYREITSELTPKP